MKWIKKGLIYKPDGRHEWSVSHAQVPIVDKIKEDILRIYFGTRDQFNRTVTSYIEVEADDPQNILYVHDKPVLGLGELGCFDDSGAMPSWIVNHPEGKYLYYIGWNVGKTVPYRLSIGLAKCKNEATDFKRVFRGPILDRCTLDPQWCAAPCVLYEDDIWRMWYLSCTTWEVHQDKPEPFYLIKCAESDDGIHWEKKDIICIDLKPPEQIAIARPCVLKQHGTYRMWYSYRGLHEYRTNTQQSYRIGYAESQDGLNWTRMDDRVGIDVSEEGWDSLMIEYPYVYEHRGKKYMIYNGNGFGQSGFGYAVLA